MKSKFEVLEYALPDWCASYLINGDASGLTVKEKEQIDNFVAKEGVRIVSINDDSSYCNINDLEVGIGGNCSTYIAHKL